MNILWTPRAAVDLSEIIDYIVGDNPEAAVRVGDKVRSHTAKLAIPPDIGNKGEVPGIRELVIHSGHTSSFIESMVTSSA